MGCSGESLGADKTRAENSKILIIGEMSKLSGALGHDREWCAQTTTIAPQAGLLQKQHPKPRAIPEFGNPKDPLWHCKIVQNHWTLQDR
jgi:hypothetical protein